MKIYNQKSKKYFIPIIVTLLVSIFETNAQENDIPETFLKSINSDIGIWIADNSEYKSKEEPYEAYGLEWKYGIGNKSLIGRLYGIKDGKDIGTFWEFRNYWDSDKKTAMLMQFGSDGTIGVGPFTTMNANETELKQVFTTPNGFQYNVGHKTKIIDSLKHIGSSFSIDEKDAWKKNRTYIWEKQSSKIADKNPQTSLNNLDFILGKWKATSKDSAFTSILEYKFSPKNKLLMATNHLYGKDGKLFAEYEGAYFIEIDEVVYFIAGPNGETHRGKALLDKDKVTHLAQLFPGKGTKSYKSEMVLKDSKLYYYANYSKNNEIPNHVDHSNPLIYEKLNDTKLSLETNKISQFDFMVGTWKMEGRNQYEEWSKVDNDSLIGHSYKIINNKKVISETLVIKQMNNKTVYEATVPTQNEGKTIQFILNTSDSSFFSFENLEHDFPKKIQYTRINDGTLKVGVFGENDKGVSYLQTKQ